METRLYTPQFIRLCLGSLFFFASFNMIIPELPAYLSMLGGEDYKGLIIALFTITAGLSRPFSGKLADTMGRRPVILFGAIVCVVCSLAYPFLGSIYGFFALRLMHGFSTGFTPTGTSALASDIIPAGRRGEAIGIMGLASSLGIALGPSVGSPIAYYFSLHTLFVCSSITAVVSVVLLSSMRETLPSPKPFALKMLRIAPAEIVEPTVWLPAFAMLCGIFSFGVVLTLIPDFSEHLGIKNKGLFFTFFTLSSFSARLFTSKLSDQIGRVPVLAVSMVVLITGQLLVGMASDRWMFLGGAMVLGLAAGLNSPALLAWAIDLSSEWVRGRAMATVYIAMEIGIGTGAFLSGILYDNNTDNLDLSFFLSAIISATGLVVLLVFGKAKRLTISAD